MIYNTDCIIGSQKYLADEGTDLIVTDPPYNLGFGGTTQTKTKRPRFSIIANDNLSDQEYKRFSIMWLKEAYRVLKPGRHIYVFIDWRMYSLIFHLMKHVGFQIKNCIVWDKVNMGMGWQYRYRHEFIIFAVKGKSKVRRIGSRAATDILRVPRISGNKTIHPTEKPTDVIKPLVLNSSLEGEHIVDFFCGSGPVKEVADETGRLFTGFEIDPEHYSNAIKR
ncbi:Modification methylase DpnIIB [compost metagenome]